MVFGRYVGANGLAAEVVAPGGKVRREALANLRPYRGGAVLGDHGPLEGVVGGRMLPPGAVRWYKGLEGSISSGSVSSDGD